jgi:hypothetical protein
MLTESPSLVENQQRLISRGASLHSLSKKLQPQHSLVDSLDTCYRGGNKQVEINSTNSYVNILKSNPKNQQNPTVISSDVKLHPNCQVSVSDMGGTLNDELENEIEHAYHGQIKDGLFHGKGKLIYNSNESYEVVVYSFKI